MTLVGSESLENGPREGFEGSLSVTVSSRRVGGERRTLCGSVVFHYPTIEHFVVVEVVV